MTMFRWHHRHRLLISLLSLLAATACRGGPGAASSAALTAAPGAIAVVDPCSLLSADEAASLAGVAVGPPEHGSGACSYLGASDISPASVSLFALPAAQSEAFVGHYGTALESMQVISDLDPAAGAKLNTDTAAGDMPGVVNDLFALTAKLSSYEIQKVDGLGNAALFSWHQNGVPEGAVIAANPGVLVALLLRGAPATMKDEDQAAMQALVRRTLAALPEQFTAVGVP